MASDASKTAPVDPEIVSACQIMARRLGEGKVIPFLGAGANLCERPSGSNWKQDGYLPSGYELAQFLAESYAYPESGVPDLVRASQYVELTAGDAALVDELHGIFASGYTPNKLHKLLAELPAQLRAKDAACAGQLLITTNYDDALEHAFAEAKEPVDVVAYMADAAEPGWFVHIRPDGERHRIPKHTDYRDFAIEERSVILKIHGSVDRSDESDDSYVITEDDYIDFLARENAGKMIPAYLMARMRTSHFLFLGYGMKDWNLRVILKQIWSEQARRFASWAIQRAPDKIDERFWERNQVDIIDFPLDEWVDEMRRHLQ